MLAKASGSCLSLVSYSAWLIEVYKDNKLIGKGLIWLGASRPLFAEYYASCNPKKSPWNPVWQGIGCESTANFNLQVSVPGWKLTCPNCSSTCPTS